MGSRSTIYWEGEAAVLFIGSRYDKKLIIWDGPYAHKKRWVFSTVLESVEIVCRYSGQTNRSTVMEDTIAPSFYMDPPAAV